MPASARGARLPRAPDWLLRGARGPDLLEVLWAVGDKELLYSRLGAEAKTALRGACRSARSWVDACVSSLTIAPCASIVPRSPWVLHVVPPRLVARWRALRRLRVLLSRRVLCEGGCSCDGCVLGPEAVQDALAGALAAALPLLARQLQELQLHFLAADIEGAAVGRGGGQSPWPLPNALVPWVACFLPRLRTLRITGCVEVVYRPLDEMHPGSRPHLLYSGLAAFAQLHSLHLATPAGLHFVPLLAPRLRQLTIERPAAAAPHCYTSVGVGCLLEGLAALTRLTSLSLVGHQVCPCCRAAPQVRPRVCLVRPGAAGPGPAAGAAAAAAAVAAGWWLTVGAAGRAVGMEELARVAAVFLRGRRMLRRGAARKRRGQRPGRRAAVDTDDGDSSTSSGGGGGGGGADSDGDGGRSSEEDDDLDAGDNSDTDTDTGTGMGMDAAAADGAAGRGPGRVGAPPSGAPSIRAALLAAAPVALRVPRLVMSGRPWEPLPRPAGAHEGDVRGTDSEGPVVVWQEPKHTPPLPAGGGHLRMPQRLRSLCMGGTGGGADAPAGGGARARSGGGGGGGGGGSGGGGGGVAGAGARTGATSPAGGTWEVQQLDLRAPGCVHALRQLAALLPPGSPPPPHIILVDSSAWAGHRLRAPEEESEDEDDDWCTSHSDSNSDSDSDGDHDNQRGQQARRQPRRLDGSDTFAEALRYALPPVWGHRARRLTIVCPRGAVRSAGDVLTAAAALPNLELAVVAGGGSPAAMLWGRAGWRRRRRGTCGRATAGGAGLEQRGHLRLEVLITDCICHPRGPLSAALCEFWEVERFGDMLGVRDQLRRRGRLATRGGIRPQLGVHRLRHQGPSAAQSQSQQQQSQPRAEPHVEPAAEFSVAAIVLGGIHSGSGWLDCGAGHGRLGAIPAAGPHAPDPDAELEALLGTDAELWGNLPRRNERWRAAVAARRRRQQRQQQAARRAARRDLSGDEEEGSQPPERAAAAADGWRG
ncbi:hypothetical protein HXX76_011597 [Chlamydomonas incerta]|uniref:Uncharacterized protein n=1 Tax=Chlamydomonas incerta TaxID=51695 RepID=A0A835SUF4_CHLIN|nr:hypothetical protein HXX76_011597 [Chlamydomonas incerta]|eukprot:KAG2428479.1 hypothetical protein HXX76_011597 [Chlamydomonas incerta]